MSNTNKFVEPVEVDHKKAVKGMRHDYNNDLNKFVTIPYGDTKISGVLIGLVYDDTNAGDIKAFQIRDSKTQKIIEIPFQTKRSIQEEMQQ